MSKDTVNRHAWPQLMVAAHDGDGRAYGRLLREITPVLRRFLLRRLFDTTHVEDVLQDILMAIHISRHTFLPGQPFDRWLFGIARHKAIDAVQHHYRAGKNENLFSGNETLLSTDTNEEDERAMTRNVEAALAQLPDRQRKAVVMARLEGHSVAETAAACGMTESAVKVTVQRATQKMKLWLARHGYE